MHRSTFITAETFATAHQQFMRMCTGEQISIELIGGTLVFSFGSSRVTVPTVSPANGRAFQSVRNNLPNTLMVWYKSTWPELQAMPCAGGTILLVGDKLMTLPGVDPATFVWYDSILPQLIIARVETSPFGGSCAALLQVGSLSEDVATSYIFPKEELIVLEGTTATNSSGRVHYSINCPGTGPTYGDVPFVYPWKSPDEKRHGWAAALYGRWEVRGKERPTGDGVERKVSETSFTPFEGKAVTSVDVEHVPLVIADRSVEYDPSSMDEEWYDLFLGKEPCRFRFFRRCGGFYQLARNRMNTLAHRHLRRCLHRRNIRCVCDYDPPPPVDICFSGFISL